MKSTVRTLCAVLLMVLAGVVLPAQAQEAGTSPQQVISANPFGLLLEFFNAEYERGVSRTGTMGVGGSFASYEDDLTGQDVRYFNMDVFYRFYPQGTVLSGWNFGVKLGVTDLESGAYAGYGFDLNRSWLLGVDDNFYVSAGFGLKRLIGEVGEREIDVIPTIRIVNVGFKF